MIEEYSSKNLDHLGIVSTMCDEINLVNVMDHLVTITKNDPFVDHLE